MLAVLALLGIVFGSGYFIWYVDKYVVKRNAGKGDEKS